MSSKWSRFLSKPISTFNFSRILSCKKLSFVENNREHFEEAHLTNNCAMAANTCREYDFDSSSNENLLQTNKCPLSEPIIRSEADYSQPSSLHSTIPETNDVGTEPCIETDNVYITCEIYSLTDLPDCLQPEMQTEPKPGITIPEYFDGQCAILRSYRCKGVNTTEKLEISIICEPLNDQSYPPLRSANEPDISSKDPQQYFPSQNVRQLRLTVQTQLQPEIETILDASDGPLCHPKCPNLRVTEATQTAEYVADLEDGVTMTPTRQDLTTIQEQDEDSTAGIDDGVSSMAATVSEHKSTAETADAKKAIVGRKRHSAIYVPTFFTDNADQPDMDRRYRRSSSSIFEMGTLLDTHSCAWLDRPRRRKECRVICTRPSDSICSDSRIRDSLSCCTNFGQAISSPSAIQCDAVISSGVASCPAASQQVTCVQYERSEDRCVEHGGNRACRAEMASWTDPNEFWPANCWISKGKRCLDPFRESFMRHQMCRVNNAHGCTMARAAVDCCTQSRPIHDNAYNRYYSNFNHAYNTIAGHCFCNNGYNAGNMNTYRAAMRSWPGYYAAPSYCCTFNAWY